MAINKPIVAIATVALGALAFWMWQSGANVPTAPDPTKDPRYSSASIDEGKTQATTAPATRVAHSETTPTATSVADNATPEPLKRIVVPQEKLSDLYLVKCSSCHGRDGKGPVGPSIAGKSEKENLAMLRRYKANEVENTLMADLLTRTSDEELARLAHEISQFK